MCADWSRIWIWFFTRSDSLARVPLKLTEWAQMPLSRSHSSLLITGKLHPWVLKICWSRNIYLMVPENGFCSVNLAVTSLLASSLVYCMSFWKLSLATAAMICVYHPFDLLKRLLDLIEFLDSYYTWICFQRARLPSKWSRFVRVLNHVISLKIAQSCTACVNS